MIWVVEGALEVEDGEEDADKRYSDEQKSCTSDVWKRPESPGSLIQEAEGESLNHDPRGL